MARLMGFAEPGGRVNAPVTHTAQLYRVTLGPLRTSSVPRSVQSTPLISRFPSEQGLMVSQDTVLQRVKWIMGGKCSMQCPVLSNCH